jgi:hypothetical protein
LLPAIPTVNPVVSHDSEALALVLGNAKATGHSAKASLSLMSLAEAQQMIATDWLAVYRSKGLTPAQ